MQAEIISQLTETGRNTIPYITNAISKISPLIQEIHLEKPKMLFLFFPIILFFVIPLRGRLNSRKRSFLLSRIIILSLLLIATASPYVLKEDDGIEKKSTITVLVDSSESMGLYPNYRSIAKNAFEEIKSKVSAYTTESDIKINYFGGGNRTALGDALYQTILGSSKENNIILVVSDGKSNHGKDLSSIARLISESNATIYPILPGPSYLDASITNVYGAAKTPKESDYEVIVEVSRTGGEASEYDLRIHVDGDKKTAKKIKQTNTTEYIGFTLTFKDEGIRRITFELVPSGNDFFHANNNYTKVVEVVAKPKVLVVSSNPNSPLSQILRKLYDVTEAGSIPRDFTPYSAIYIDNIDSHLLDVNTESLRNYVTDGNGLVIVGGNASYDWGGYNLSYIENMLPVRSREKPKEKRRPITALFLIDISGSGQYTGITEKTIDLEKALAIKLIGELDLNDSLGVIAFNMNAFPISNIVPVDVGRDKVIDRILKLKSGGDTDMIQALEMSEDYLREESNERIIVLLSDGIIRLTRLPSTVDSIKSLTQKGVKVYLVGVGQDNVGISTLKYISQASGALFFEPKEYQRLKLSFNREAKDDKEKISVAVLDPHHFITRNLNLGGAEISDYNNVREKLNAQVLLSTEGGSPILTVWRFGLGRVASLSTDNGLTWATGLYSGEAAKFIPSLTNWVVGDIEGRKDTLIEAGDSFLGEPAFVIAKCDKPLVVRLSPFDGEEEDFPVKRIGLNLYTGEYHASTSGVYLAGAASEDGADSTGFSVNYPKEFKDVGVDLEGLEKLARLSQGKLYVSGESLQLTQDVVFSVKNRSKVTSTEKNHLTLYFLAATLTLYFIDTAARRISDIIRLTGAK
ncbi:MAG: VWA domain-containing protein [Methanobacteriota archaeon]